ncbi:hypothetical protein BV25DRAFT_1921465 [Artomyces pyxidatus]|uniref:Uncharacterized protein n=1 Tax=Artomyces pyxidatus TaxID=48021 RepID=A0ACB8SIZ7_9AGAM|nr:hypothetical protein BV25DRAFT_1921465 [Artomyces pyxidatus]
MKLTDKWKTNDDGDISVSVEAVVQVLRIFLGSQDGSDEPFYLDATVIKDLLEVANDRPEQLLSSSEFLAIVLKHKMIDQDGVRAHVPFRTAKNAKNETDAAESYFSSFIELTMAHLAEIDELLQERKRSATTLAGEMQGFVKSFTNSQALLDGEVTRLKGSIEAFKQSAAASSRARDQRVRDLESRVDYIADIIDDRWPGQLQELKLELNKLRGSATRFRAFETSHAPQIETIQDELRSLKTLCLSIQDRLTDMDSAMAFYAERAEDKIEATVHSNPSYSIAKSLQHESEAFTTPTQPRARITHSDSIQQMLDVEEGSDEGISTASEESIAEVQSEDVVCISSPITPDSDPDNVMVSRIQRREGSSRWTALRKAGQRLQHALHWPSLSQEIATDKSEETLVNREAPQSAGVPINEEAASELNYHFLDFLWLDDVIDTVEGIFWFNWAELVILKLPEYDSLAVYGMI